MKTVYTALLTHKEECGSNAYLKFSIRLMLSYIEEIISLFQSYITLVTMCPIQLK